MATQFWPWSPHPTPFLFSPALRSSAAWPLWLPGRVVSGWPPPNKGWPAVGVKCTLTSKGTGCQPGSRLKASFQPLPAVQSAYFLQMQGVIGNSHGKKLRCFVLWKITEGPALNSSPPQVCRGAGVIPICLTLGQDSWWEYCLTLTLRS